MICVGIDVAKDKHDCFILSSEGEVLADVFTIPKERTQRSLREDWVFHRGDLYIADLGSGTVSICGTHVQGGVRPVVLLQNNTGNFFSPTLIVVGKRIRLTVQPDALYRLA